MYWRYFVQYRSWILCYCYSPFFVHLFKVRILTVIVYTTEYFSPLNLLVQFARFWSSCVKNFLVFPSTSLPFASNLSCANVTMTSGPLTGYIFKNTNIWRRWYWALAPPSIPIDALIIATGLPSNELSPYGLDAQSIAFFSTPGTEKLYSGVAMRIASDSSLIFDLNSFTFVGISLSRSWLNAGIPRRSKISRVTPPGSNSTAARRSALLYEPALRLPAKPRIF